MSHLKITSRSAMCLSWNILSVFLYSQNVCMCISILPSVHHFCFPCPNLSHTFRSPLPLSRLSFRYLLCASKACDNNLAFILSTFSLAVLLYCFELEFIHLSYYFDFCCFWCIFLNQYPFIRASACSHVKATLRLQDDSEGNLIIGELEARNISSKKFM
jgi:hypothetical protein